MRIRTIAVIAALSLSVAACGTSRDERALTGAGVGAAAGAVGAAVVGGAVVTGAVVGAAAGAVIGAVSDPRRLRLD